MITSIKFYVDCLIKSLPNVRQGSPPGIRPLARLSLKPVLGKVWPMSGNSCRPIGWNLWRRHVALGSVHNLYSEDTTNGYSAWTWSSKLYGHSAWVCMQNRYAKWISWWTNIVDKHWVCSVDMDTQHGHKHPSWTWTCSIDMDMQQDHGHAARTWKYSTDRTCSISNGMDMQHRQGHAVSTWTCRIAVDMEHEHGYEAQTTTYSRDMDIDIDMDLNMKMDLDMVTATDTGTDMDIHIDIDMAMDTHTQMHTFFNKTYRLFLNTVQCYNILISILLFFNSNI